MQIIKYETETEADKIKSDKQKEGYILISVSNVKEGNFLGFAKTEDLQVIPNPESTDVFEKLTQIETRLKFIEEGQDSLRSLSK